MTRHVIGIQWDDAHVTYTHREVGENHLLLNGWFPLMYGGGGAGKVVYAGHLNVHVVYIFHSNAVNGRGTVVRDVMVSLDDLRKKGRVLDGPHPWGHIGSDGDFTLMLNRCIKEDNDGHNPF